MTHSQVIENSRRHLLVFARRKGITRACKEFGVSRTSFYKIKKQYVKTGSLAPRIRRRPRMPNEVALSKKKMLLRMVQMNPSWGPERFADEFRKQGIRITGACIWHHLHRYGLSRKFHRLIYVETLRMAKQPVTERSLRQLKTKWTKMHRGQWPGHIVALDTFYVGHIKGVGRIYQTTGLDLCSRYGWAQLSSDKGQQSTSNFVEGRLIPLFAKNGVTIENVLSDNGKEFTGSGFQNMLKAYDIGHLRIPKGKPIFNGTCERFQRTINDEFYQRVFRVKFFKTLKALQEELDQYLVFYNFERTHFGLDKQGAIPIDVFAEKKSFLRQRFQKLLT